MRKSKGRKRCGMCRPSSPIKPALLTLAIAQALAFQAVQAASIEVTSNLDDGTECTLREAIATVNAGADQLNGCILTGDPLWTNDTITLSQAVSGQTITLAQGELQITKDVNINPGGVNTTIDGNQASRVISIENGDTSDLSVTMDQLTITEGNSGGGINMVSGIDGYYVDTTASLALTNSTVSDNGGPGINTEIRIRHYNQASLTVTNSTVSGNSGGGINVSHGGNLTLTNSTVSGNGTGSAASGIHVYYAYASLANSTVSGNNGSGIYLFVSGSTLTNSTVSDNSGGRGGIFGIYSSTNLTNSTVSGNTGDSGGGISIDYASLKNSTVSDNTGGNGGISVFDSNASLTNSIVANNTAGYGVQGIKDCYSRNYYGPVDFNAGTDTISTSDCGGAIVADPLLGPLADNGGPTQTHALLAGSPAIDNGTGPDATTSDQRGVAAEGVRDSGAYEFATAMDALTIEKLINHRVRETPGTAAQLLAGTRYRAEYKVTNNSPDRIYSVQVFEGGELVCNLYALDPGESKQRYKCASNQDVLLGSNSVPATVTGKVSGSSQVLTDQGNAYYTGLSNMPGKLKVTHYVNGKNADTQASAVYVNGNEADVTFRVENTGQIELYRVNTFHDPASPVNSGWQQKCFIGTLDPGQVRYCKRTIDVTQAGLNKAFGRAQGSNANVSPTGFVNASNPTYFNVVLP